VFVVNIENITRDDGSVLRRRGSDRDYRKIKRVFGGLGYDFFNDCRKDLRSEVSKNILLMFQFVIGIMYFSKT